MKHGIHHLRFQTETPSVSRSSADERWTVDLEITVAGLAKQINCAGSVSPIGYTHILPSSYDRVADSRSTTGATCPAADGSGRI